MFGINRNWSYKKDEISSHQREERNVTGDLWPILGRVHNIQNTLVLFWHDCLSIITSWLISNMMLDNESAGLNSSKVMFQYHE